MRVRKRQIGVIVEPIRGKPVIRARALDACDGLARVRGANTIFFQAHDARQYQADGAAENRQGHEIKMLWRVIFQHDEG